MDTLDRQMVGLIDVGLMNALMNGWQIVNIQCFVFALVTHPGRIFSFNYLSNAQNYASGDDATVLYELRGTPL